MRRRRGEIYQMSVSVSIHASVKDATSCRHARLLFQFSFNPRICKRCDNTVFGYQRPWYVSIHASVKDATFRVKWTGSLNIVSIHASVKDATFLVSLLLLRILFQSTHL